MTLQNIGHHTAHDSDMYTLETAQIYTEAVNTTLLCTLQRYLLTQDSTLMSTDSENKTNTYKTRHQRMYWTLQNVYIHRRHHKCMQQTTELTAQIDTNKYWRKKTDSHTTKRAAGNTLRTVQRYADIYATYTQIYRNT